VDVDAAIQLIKEWPVNAGPANESFANSQEQRFGEKFQDTKSAISEPSKSGAAALVATTEPGIQLNTVFAIIKHTNVCGIAQRTGIKESWEAALAGDPESAFGGVLITNGTMDKSTAEAVNEIFFEVLIAPDFDEYANI
jgi:AICAR transformylase/IMP cyclohydrolase PurH